MTVPDEAQFVTDQDYGAWTGPTVPVHIVRGKDEKNIRVPPEFGSCMTYSVPLLGSSYGVEQGVQILPRRYWRDKARIWVASAGGSPIGTSVSAHGSVTSPTANQAIAAIPASDLVAGVQYSVTAYVYVDGTTAAATDDDNMQVNVNATSIAKIPYNADTSDASPYAFTIPVSPAVNGTNQLTVSAIAAGTTGSVYHATIVATPTSSSSGAATGVLFATTKAALSAQQGILWPAGNASPQIEWSNQQPLFAVAIGGGPATVIVLDQSFSERSELGLDV